MDFQISGLPSSEFAALYALSDEQLAAHAALRLLADRRPGFPCRVSLVDAEPGERVLLVNYEHLPVASPYRSRHAIFVREHARDAQLDVNEIPESLQIRLLSLRAFDAAGMMTDADVVAGNELAAAIVRMLERPAVAYLHAHNAKPGCYAARIDRSAR
jgi:Protein of unknown function (DUF1203)